MSPETIAVPAAPDTGLIDLTQVEHGSLTWPEPYQLGQIRRIDRLRLGPRCLEEPLGVPSDARAAAVIGNLVEHHPAQVGLRVVQLGERSGPQRCYERILQEVLRFDVGRCRHGGEPTELHVTPTEHLCFVGDGVTSVGSEIRHWTSILDLTY